MYKIIFYAKADGTSELEDEIIRLADKAKTSKNARIQFNQITLSIEYLKTMGTKLPINILKHIADDIWELRPGHNRILFFHFDGDEFVLLHMFRKKSQKTPRSEIEKAIKERNDYLRRNGGNLS